MLDAFADDVELALEAGLRGGVGGIEGAAGRDEQLFEARLDRDGRCADDAIVGRNEAPAEHPLPFFDDDRLKEALDLRACRLAVREKYEPRPVGAGRRQGDAERRRDFAQEAIGHLDEDAGAVPRRRFAAARAAVQQVDEDAQPLLDDRVRASALDVGDEPDTAGIVLVRRVVQPLRGGGVVPFLRKTGFRPF